MKTIRVDVVHALPGRQRVITVRLAQGATAGDAVAASGLGAGYRALGRFGRKIDPCTKLGNGDRVELLRPLRIDPNEARRQRARRLGRGTGHTAKQRGTS